MSVEYIRAKFRIKTTPNIIGDPTYKSIKELRKALYANAAAISKTLGGWNNGHVGILVNTSVYTNVAAT